MGIRLKNSIVFLFKEKDFLIYFIFEIISIISFIIGLYFKDFAYKNIKTINSLIESLDWQMSPISEIFESDTTEISCLNGYDHLINYQGNRVIHNNNCICYNQNSLKTPNEILNNYCNNVQLSLGCYNSFNRFPDLKFLKGINLCIKRDFNLNYFKLYKNIHSQEKGCPQDLEKNCGKIDSKNNILCLKPDQYCPINNLFFGNKKYMHDYDLSLMEKIKYENITDVKIIEFKNNENDFIFISNFTQNQQIEFQDKILKDSLNNKKIITYLRLEKESPCLDYRYTLRESNNIFFKNKLAQDFFCDDYKNLNYNNLNNFEYITTFNFYEDLLKENLKFGNLIDFNLNKFNNTVNLYSKNYIVDIKIPSDDLNAFENFKYEIEYFLTSLNKNFIFALLMIFSSIIFATFLIIIWICSFCAYFPKRFVFFLNIFPTSLFTFVYYSENIKKYFYFFFSLHKLAFLSQEKINLYIKQEYENLIFYFIFLAISLLILIFKIIIYVTRIFQKNNKMKEE